MIIIYHLINVQDHDINAAHTVPHWLDWELLLYHFLTRRLQVYILTIIISSAHVQDILIINSAPQLVLLFS